MKKFVLITIVALALSSCTGMRRSGDQFSAHAESFNILGLQIPEDDYKNAMKQVPAGAEIHTIESTPNDWTSVIGGLNKILGISITRISGKTSR